MSDFSLLWKLAGAALPGLLLAAAPATAGDDARPDSSTPITLPSVYTIPGGGTSILPDDVMADLQLKGDEADAAKKTRARAPDVDGVGNALRVEVPKAGRRGWTVMLATRNTEKVEQGDVLLAEFWARSAFSRDETAESTVNFFFEAVNPPPLDPRGNTDNATFRSVGSTFGSRDSMHRVNPAWRHFVVPFRANADYAPGEARLGFDVAFADQAVDVAGLRVHNFGKSVPMNDLPRVDRSTYAGREPDAAWREEAAERIEQIRKGDLQITVRDADGNPVEGADVTVEMTRHAFTFGTAIDAQWIVRDDAEAQKYRDHILELFNTVVFGNDLKWPQWEMPEWRARVEPAMAWIEENDLRVRGHVLLWGSFRFMPADLIEYKDDPEGMRRRIVEAARERPATMRGRVHEWDAVNEPYTHTDAANVIGDSIYADVFKAAREGDPDVPLYINDFGILEGGGMDAAHQAHYERTIQGIIDAGGDLGGIGFQGHFGGQPTDIERIYTILDRFSRFGVPMQVTEFDMDVPDEQLVADFQRDLMTILFSHEQVNGFMMWGFWEGRHWKPQTAMIRKDWSLKPAAEVYKDLVLNQWWTNETLTTDGDGRAGLRGFLGTYTVTVEHDGRAATRQVTLERDTPGDVEVTLE